jgi:hypothetical protein
MCAYFFSKQPPVGQGLPIHKDSRSTQRRTAVGRTLLDEWSARRRDLYLTTHNTHNRQTSMPPVGFVNHDRSRRTAVDLRLRPRGYWDRHCKHCCLAKLIIITYVCVCCLVYPACNAHAPYCIYVCVLSSCAIFFHVNS